MFYTNAQYVPTLFIIIIIIIIERSLYI